VCVLVLNLLMLVIVSGTGAATQVYRDSVFTSESAVLSDTVDAALSDVLRYATNISVEGDGTVRFSNDFYRMSDGTIFCTSGGHLKLQPSADLGEDSLLLLGSGAYTNLKLKDFVLEYDETAGVFTGTYTIVSKVSSQLTAQESFCFRPVNSPDESAG